MDDPAATTPLEDSPTDSAEGEVVAMHLDETLRLLDEPVQGGGHDADPDEVGFRELLEELISQRPTPKEPAKPKEVLVAGWDPLLLPAGPRRVQAWWRLVSFVDWLNSTFGAFRTSSGEAPRWIRAGWWLNPLVVSHLAALECAWASFQLSDKSLPMMADGPVRVLMESTRSVLDLVCGVHSASSQWGLNHERGGNAHFSLTPPPGEPDPLLVREMVEHFIMSEDVEVPERTSFLTAVVAELNS